MKRAACSVPSVAAPPSPSPSPAGALRDDVVGVEYIADYLLFTLNKQRLWGAYMERYNLEEPVDHIQEMLQHVAFNKGLLSKGRRAALGSMR